MIFPPIAQVRRQFAQPEVADVPRRHRAGHPHQPHHRPRARRRPSRHHRGQPGYRRDRPDRPGDRRDVCAVSGSSRSSSPPWAATAAERPRASAHSWPSSAWTEKTVGCPVRCEMDTVVLGTNSFGLPIHFDQNAFDADGIILLNRIKPHTSFTGRYESGLLKMLAIGLGKREGAAQVHKLGLARAQDDAPRSRRVPARSETPVALGMAILENAFEHTARIVAVEPEELLDVEPRLLDEARELMGAAPVRPDRRADRWRAGQELQRDRARPQRDRPAAGRDDARPAPPGDHPAGRAGPFGRDPRQCAGDRPGRPDHRSARARDRPGTPMRVNSLTSNFLTRPRVPLSLPTDRDVIAACLDTCWRIDPERPAWSSIPNTLELTTLWVTRPLAAEVEGHPELHFETDFQPMPLNSTGSLEQEFLFPESVRGRRARDAGRNGYGNGHAATHPGIIEERAGERVEYEL